LKIFVKIANGDGSFWQIPANRDGSSWQIPAKKNRPHWHEWQFHPY